MRNYRYRRQWEQVFQNLLSNALKYAKSEEAPVISITCITTSGRDIPYPIAANKREKEFHLLRIADNGIGFEQADAERIFDVFTRLHGVSEYKGSGIGLATVKKVVTTHGGYISASSQLGKGAVFSIYPFKYQSMKEFVAFKRIWYQCICSPILSQISIRFMATQVQFYRIPSHMVE